MKTLLLALALLLAPAAASAQAIPPAVISDPVPDAAHPPRSQQVLVPSAGLGMNALFYLAGGPGPHPTMVLFHGFPGNEQNLDLAQAVRRAGWNVLTLHYRGSWGSPGVFSLAHVQEDAKAAAVFVEDPANQAKYAIDPRRIVLGGHSMGGFAALAGAIGDDKLAGVVLLDAWNVGNTGAAFAKLDKAARAKAATDNFDDLGNSLAGTSVPILADEIAAHAAEWEVLAWAPRLTKAPMLVVGAAKAGGADNHAIAQSVAKAGGKVTDVTLPTDHSFSDHRIALAAAVVRWLDGLPAR
ncbi:MAG: alpha/beta fold hydrolase [Phenylobacterium sp.]